MIRTVLFCGPASYHEFDVIFHEMAELARVHGSLFVVVTDRETRFNRAVLKTVQALGQVPWIYDGSDPATLRRMFAKSQPEEVLDFSGSRDPHPATLVARQEGVPVRAIRRTSTPKEGKT